MTSTGVTGLTATLSAGIFFSGSGNLTYTITGTPASSGTANFALTIGGQSCSLSLNVLPEAGGTGNSQSFNIFTQNLYTGGTGYGYDENSVLNLPAGGQKLWRGGTSTNWATASNWYPSGVPSSTDDISIEVNNFTNHPILDMNRTVASIDFSGATKRIELGANNITVTRGVFNADSNNYVKTTSTGKLKRNIPTSESFSFPVGNTSYNPVTITNNTVQSDTFAIRVADSVYLNSVSGTLISTPHVNRTWHIDKVTPSANSGNGVDFEFQWKLAHEQLGITNYWLNHHDGTNWNVATSTMGSPNVGGSTVKIVSFLGYMGTFSPFAIGDNPGSALPIELVSFSAQCAQNKVVLNWTTASEHNTNYYRVDKSKDGIIWDMMNTIAASGFSTKTIDYAITDIFPARGINYYRLTQYDLDGAYETYDIAATVCMDEQKGSFLTSYPNPSSGDFIVDLYTDEIEDKGQLVMTDAKGAVVYVQDISIVMGSNNYFLSQGNIETGLYYITIRSGDHVLTTKQSIK